MYLVCAMRAFPKTATCIGNVYTSDALCVQWPVTTSETFMMTTLPLIGCHSQLTVACSTKHGASCWAYCQPCNSASKTRNWHQSKMSIHANLVSSAYRSSAYTRLLMFSSSINIPSLSVSILLNINIPVNQFLYRSADNSWTILLTKFRHSRLITKPACMASTKRDLWLPFHSQSTAIAAPWQYLFLIPLRGGGWVGLSVYGYRQRWHIRERSTISVLIELNA